MSLGIYCIHVHVYKAAFRIWFKGVQNSCLCIPWDEAPHGVPMARLNQGDSGGMLPHEIVYSNHPEMTSGAFSDQKVFLTMRLRIITLLAYIKVSTILLIANYYLNDDYRSVDSFCAARHC